MVDVTLLQNVEQRDLIEVGRQPRAGYVVLRTDRHTWPLDKTAAVGLSVVLEEHPEYDERFRCDGFVIYERRPVPRQAE